MPATSPSGKGTKAAVNRPAFEPSLKGRALRLLARREHTRRELERKLASYEETPGTLAAALDELQAQGWLNETRAAESLVHRRAGRLGVARLRQEMLEKGVSRELIEQTLANLQGNDATSELARAREVWRRRFGVMPGEAKERARQARFLLARGFSGEVVRRVLGEDEGQDA